jgi:aconitate hydratase
LKLTYDEALQNVALNFNLRRYNEGCVYDRVIEIDLGTLGPHINGPYTPDLCTPVADLGARAVAEGWPMNISSCLIGAAR